MANSNDNSGLSSAHLLQESSDEHPRAHEQGSGTHDHSWNAFPNAAWITHSTVVVISAVTPVVATIVWLALSSANGSFSKLSVSAFSGESIGGKLSQPQAKAVDVLCSAILGPCFVAVLNYFWFSYARVSTVNERSPRSHAGVPFSSFVAVSTSVGGSYDIWKLAALLRGRTWGFFLLAVLTLLSAIARSTVSNIIAYEAYTELKEQTDALRLLADKYLKSDFFRGADTSIGVNFSASQQSSVANQITGLLTGLTFEDATGKLDDGAYVGVNATGNSMNNLSPNVTKLFNVPGHRLTVDCAPDQPYALGVVAMGGYTTVIDSNLKYKVSDGWGENFYQAWYRGIPADIQGAYNDEYQFAAFLLNATEVYLGYLTSSNMSNVTMSSPYGDIQPRSSNMTTSGFSGTKAIMSYWGIRCWLNREDGLLNYTRNDGRWTLSESNFTNKTVKVHSSLANWQTNLNYHAPGATIPGIGPALAKTAGQIQCAFQCDNATDFSKLALNYLYASAESERILYDVLATNTSDNQPELWYNVSSAATHEYYRITYVPAILIASLISLFGAAAATIAMAAYAFKTYSGRTFRQVDVLRLAVDSLDGFEEIKKDIVDLPRAELDSWASSCRVGYDKDGDNSAPVFRVRNID